MMLVLVNMVLNVKHNQVFGKIIYGLILQIFMVGFNGILNIGQLEDLQMMRDKLIDGKNLLVDSKVNQLG